MFKRRTIRNLSAPVAASVLAAGLAVLAGCGGGGGGSSTSNLPPAVAAALRSAGSVPPAIVNANNTFGFSLLTQMRTTDAGKNVFISPTSLSLCLEILYNGSATTTQSAMAQTMNLTQFALPDVNNDNALLQASLVNPDPSVQISIANSFWYYKASHQILSSFINTNTQFYGSQIGDLTGAPQNINAWVSQQTHGAITQVVDNSIRNANAAVVNAVYFKGLWSQKFDPALTAADTFTLADGSTTTCNMMHRDDQFGYFKGDHFQAVKIPYGSGRVNMIVFLPDAGTTVDGFLGEVNAANWSSWMSQFSMQQGSVALPRFTSTYSVDLKPVLSSLGMSIAFDPNNADFSNIGPALYLSSATHKSYLQVDETGTVAAGVTTGGVGTTAAPSDVFNIKMNRPFVCAIVDDKTGDILFYGAIDKPTE